MFEPMYKVGFISRLLDCSPGTVRSLIEAGHFGEFEVLPRGDMSVPHSGIRQFFERQGSRGVLIFEPHLRATWVAEFLGRRPVDLRADIEGGILFGPDWLRLPGGELRVPLSGLQQYKQQRRIQPAHA